MKRWLLLKLAGPLGFIVRPILAAMIGALLAVGFDQFWELVSRNSVLHAYALSVVALLDPDFVKSLTPLTLGTTIAVAIWGFGMDWVMKYLRVGAKEIQTSANESLTPGHIPVDGIILPGGKTSKLVSRMAYESKAERS